MIGKLRKKFVAVCMALVAAVLLSVLLAVYMSMHQNLIRTSDQLLERALQNENIRPNFSLEMGGSPIMLPYFTVTLRGSTAYVTSGTYQELEDTQTLQDIITRCLAQEADSGTLPGYSLRYLRQNHLFSKRIAFVDMSMEQTILSQMMRSYTGIILVALAVLLAISIALAFWITKPVERAWQQQRQFISDASHELKTPLTVILSNAELLSGAELSGAPTRWVDHIRSEGTQMKELVEQMLILAQADNAVSTAVFEQVDLSELVMDTCLAFEPVAFEAGKGLEDRIEENIVVTADPGKLCSLISILLDNAIKYGKAGEPILLQLSRTDRFARLQVENGGEPIPPQQLRRLFERFYRADASRGEQGGFGLGLPIAATIAAEHKGALRAESDEKSTRFIFTIPLRRS